MSLEVSLENSQKLQVRGDATEMNESPYDNPDTEHIYIGDEFADQAGEPNTVRQREYLRNHVLGTITEVTFYEEGFLKIREGNKKALLKEHIVELRFLDPEPVVSRRIATSWFWSAIGSGAMALLGATMLPMTKLSGYVVPINGVLSAVTLLFLTLFIHRTHIAHRFHTASGKAGVVSLTASLGCVRRARAVSMQIQAAIDRARGDSGAPDIHYLRAEMQAHYKLADAGVISRKTCSDGTALILSKFG